VKSTNGGKTDRSPWSEGGAREGGANAPHGNGGDHRSSPESSSKVAGDSQSPERMREIRVRVESSEREEGVRLAGPG
jgi:hypothetical protein